MKKCAIFWIKNYLSLGLLTGHTSCRRGLLKRTSSTSDHKIYLFLFFVDLFCPPGSGSGFRIRIHWPDWTRIQSGSGPETLSTMQFPPRSNRPLFFLSRLNLPPWKRRKGLDEDSILKMNDKTPKVDTNSVNNPVAKVTQKMSISDIIVHIGSEFMRKLTLIRQRQWGGLLTIGT